MKKKLLLINGHLNTGGVEKSLLDILRHLDYNKYEVDLLLLEDFGEYADQIPPQVRVKMQCLKNTYGSVKESLLRCIRHRDWYSLKMRLVFLAMKFYGQKYISLAKNMLTGGKQYDCVIGYRPGICSQIAAFAVNADRRITWWHHGEVNVQPAPYLQMAKVCDYVAVVSEPCKKMLSDTFPDIESKLVTISNMLDVDEIRTKAEQFIPYSGNNRLHIVSVGRLVEEKHFENAIYSAKRLKASGVSFFWHLIGDGILREKLERQAIAANVSDCFVFEGNQVNPYPYIKHADLFVHPSYVESQGIVVMEALALGVPCVVTKSAGPCEYIEDGINGLLTEQNADDLADRVVEVLENQEIYNSLRVNAFCPIQYTPQTVMESIERLFEE